MKFEKFLRAPFLKNVCKHLQRSASSSSSLKLDLVELTVFPDLNLGLAKMNIFTAVCILNFSRFCGHTFLSYVTKFEFELCFFIYFQ